MRLFTGTFVRGIIAGKIYDTIKKDFSRAVFGKWVEPENIHFTYKFLGDCDNSTCKALKEQLEGVFTNYGEALHIVGTGVFPNPAKPRILYAAVEHNDLLRNIFTTIEKAAVGLGFEPEDRPFRPHITLMRIKESNNTEFREALEKYKGHEFGSLDGFRVSLVESRLSSAGPVYREIG